MSALSPGLEAELSKERALVAMLLRADLPGHTMRLLIGGAGAISWGDQVFSDVDPVFGTLATMDSFEDGSGDEAPDWSFSMYPPTNSSAAQLCSPTYQEAPVYIWLAAFSPVTGLLIPDPYSYQSFLWDVATLMPGRQKREVDIQCVSMFERLLEDDEGARLSDAFHQSIRPGETGFANVTGNPKNIYWGLATPPTGAVVTQYSYAGADGGFER